jgi:hypothetical protein
MEYSFVFFRDRIVLNNDLKNRIKLESTPPGSKILLAAREFVVDGPLTLDGRDLVLLADSFDGSQGSIQLKALATGAAGPKVTIACRRIAGLAITSTGGVGEQGATGEPGAEGKPGRPASLPHKPGGPGGAGGRGGRGGRGKIGGPGGDITIVFVEDQVPGGIDTANVQVPGGPGGPGGEGGPGGPGGEGGPGNPDGRNGPDGPQGFEGPVGPTGVPGTVQKSQVDEAGYFQVLQFLSDQWAAYRLRVAEYYFRAFNPSGPPTSTYLDLAFSELRAVLQLDPQNVQAAAYVNQILNNQNVLGLAREIDIIPDFPYYEQVLADYGPLVLSLFQSATNLLQGNLTLDQMRQTLTREIAHLEGLKLALEAELAAAIRGRQVAETEQQMARTRVLAIQDRIRDRREELENRRIDWGGVLTFGVFAVGAGIIALATGGAGAGMLFAYLPDLMGLAGADFGPIPGKDQADILAKARGLKEYTAAKNNLPNSVMPLVVSFAKMVKDLSEAQGDAEMIQLLREATELTHAQLLAQMRNDQASFALDAVMAHLAQAVQDLELARTQLGGLTGDIQFLGAQRYMDVLIKYAFFAARALEIYTLTDMSDEIRTDYGYIHPDIEQDYEDGILPLAQLIGAYMTSWSRFVDIVNYRNAFDSYFGSSDRVHDKVFLAIADPAVLAQFRATQNLLLAVDLPELPPTRFEAKAIYVLLSLTGATAEVPAISCLVEHGGQFTTRKRDGSIAGLILKPRTTVVQTAKSGIAFTGVRIGANPDELSFWGRGVAATWNISIEPDEMARRQIDLSGLSSIEVEIGYEAFL